jgi:hypothetical protein
MSHSYSEAMSSPIDLSRGENVAERHGELMCAFEDLLKLVGKEFL